MEIYITIYKIDSQQEFAVWLRKLKQGLCINLEGWDGDIDGREFQKGGDICISMADSYCSWGYQGKNTEVVCHSLLQWTTFCQTSPP